MDDYYLPSSFIFYTKYDDYGRYTLDKNFIKENSISWESLRENILSPASLTDNETLNELKEILNHELEDSFVDLFKIISEGSCSFSNMSFDRLVFDTFVQDCKERKYLIYNKITSEYVEESLFNKIKDYYVKEVLPKLDIILSNIGEPFTLLLSDCFPQGLDFYINSLSRFNYKNSYQKDFFHFLNDEYKKDPNSLEFFIINYLFMQYIENLHLPLNVEIYGGQTSNTVEQALKIKGELNSLRNEIRCGFEEGFSEEVEKRFFPNFDFENKESYSYENIKHTISQLSDGEVLEYFLEKTTYL